MQTVLVKKNAVPGYLRASPFLKSWDDAEEEAVEIPIRVFKPDTTVRDFDELKHLLESLRYWMIDDLPFTVIKYVLDTPSTVGIVILEDFKEQIRDVRCVLEWLHEPQYLLSLACMLSVAVRVDSVNCARYLLQQKPPFSAYQTWDLCAIAASAGSINCLTYLHKLGYPWDTRTVHNSAANGHAECLLYALKHGCAGPHQGALTAIEHGKLHILKLLPGLKEHTDLVTVAARTGQLECLKYLQSLHGEPVLGIIAVCNAAEHGHLSCLKYLHEQGYAWNASVTYLAATNGHLECLKYAVENGCAHSESAYWESANMGIFNYLETLGYGNF